MFDRFKMAAKDRLVIWNARGKISLFLKEEYQRKLKEHFKHHEALYPSEWTAIGITEDSVGLYDYFCLKQAMLDVAVKKELVEKVDGKMYRNKDYMLFDIHNGFVDSLSSGWFTREVFEEFEFYTP